MTPASPKPHGRSDPLWRWVAVRMSLLAVGTMLVIAFCMWLRLALATQAMERRMPPAARADVTRLMTSPETNKARIWPYLERYYEVADFMPGLLGDDWLVFYGLVLVSIPVVGVLGVVASRPLSRQFSNVAAAGRRVAGGDFSARASVTAGAPLELRHLAEDFNAMCEKLSRYEREVMDSSAILAHELRTPLNAAMGRVQGILDGVFEPEPAQLSMILRQLVQLNRLISDIHFLSVARAGELRLSIDDFDLAALVDERVHWSALALRDAGVACSTALDAPAPCHGDRDRIGQVVSILIENAIRYAASGGVLSLRLTREGEDGYALAVEDRGPGVPDEALSRIFDRFWRAEHSRGRHSGGSGLGLSIASVIVEAHGGVLRAANREGGGLRITASLPRHAD